MNFLFTLYLCCFADLAHASQCSCPPSSVTRSPVTTTSAPTPAGKRGLAYNEAHIANSFLAKDHKCSWAYNWDSADNGLATGIEFVPMLWGQKMVTQFQQNINFDSIGERKFKYILGFNEPDHPDQANMTVMEAVDSYMTNLNKYSTVALIGSPAVTSHDSSTQTNRKTNPKGLDWLQDFLFLCEERGCKVHFCAVHWYGDTTQAEDMVSFLRDAHSICPGKPIWLTEFRAAGSSAAVSAFLRTVLPILDSMDFVQRYAWFMATTNNLLTSEDALSDYGQVYASL